MARKARITAKPSRCIELSKNNKVHATNDKALINRAKQDLRRWQDRRDTSKIYIGKTSAPTGGVSAAYKAMKGRVDKTKKMGTTDMKLLYINKSDSYIKNAEKKPIDYNERRPKKAGNQTGGRGGAPTDQPYKVLYAAVTRKGKGRCQRKR